MKHNSGYWTQIEGYIEQRSMAQFSHSICPDCARKMYPDLMGGPKNPYLS